MLPEITLEYIGKNLLDFPAWLRGQEKAQSTIDKYVRDVSKFMSFFKNRGGGSLDRQDLVAYKAELQNRYKPASINSYLISLNVFLGYLGAAPSLHVKTLRIQRKVSLNNILLEAEYRCLVQTARLKKNKKMYFLLRTLASSGIRVGELRYITVDMLKKGSVTVTSKGKVREIIVPDTLCGELLAYCDEKNIHGLVFAGRNPEQMMHTSYIWRELKKLALESGVPEERVYAHAFRHLFAKKFISCYQDIVDLADILGHSSIETTRIYTRTSGQEKRIRINGLAL